ncbi:MAG TPA: pilus assembly protein N-terminal domain-containing protein [Thermohalobaculum sp.]|nr:pilus assembly protein N-terminal domain-containing protein [Thermohalobaculum sp.]
MRIRLRQIALVVPLLAAGGARAGMEGVTAGPAIPASPEVAVRAAALRLGHAEVVRFSEPVGTIIVGDSGVLDATAVNDRTVVLTALAAGTTNVVVLGEEAEVLSRLNVRVSVPQEPRAEVFRGSERTVMVCNPDCVPLGAPPGGRAGGIEAEPSARAGAEAPAEGDAAEEEPADAEGPETGGAAQ